MFFLNQSGLSVVILIINYFYLQSAQKLSPQHGMMTASFTTSLHMLQISSGGTDSSSSEIPDGPILLVLSFTALLLERQTTR